MATRTMLILQLGTGASLSAYTNTYGSQHRRIIAKGTLTSADIDQIIKERPTVTHLLLAMERLDDVETANQLVRLLVTWVPQLRYLQIHCPASDPAHRPETATQLLRLLLQTIGITKLKSFRFQFPGKLEVPRQARGPGLDFPLLRRLESFIFRCSNAATLLDRSYRRYLPEAPDSLGQLELLEPAKSAFPAILEYPKRAASRFVSLNAYSWHQVTHAQLDRLVDLFSNLKTLCIPFRRNLPFIEVILLLGPMVNLRELRLNGVWKYFKDPAAGKEALPGVSISFQMTAIVMTAVLPTLPSLTTLWLSGLAFESHTDLLYLQLHRFFPNLTELVFYRPMHRCTDCRPDNRMLAVEEFHECVDALTEGLPQLFTTSVLRIRRYE